MAENKFRFFALTVSGKLEKTQKIHFVTPKRYKMNNLTVGDTNKAKISSPLRKSFLQFPEFTNSPSSDRDNFIASPSAVLDCIDNFVKKADADNFDLVKYKTLLITAKAHIKRLLSSKNASDSYNDGYIFFKSLQIRKLIFYQKAKNTWNG